MVPPTLRSEALVLSIVEQMARGASLRQLSLEPGMPGWFTLMRWQRRDPALKARFAQARARGRGVRFEGRYPDRFRFDPVKALELVERVRAGEPLLRLARRYGVVERQALNIWKRVSPDFALRLEAAKLAGRAVRARRLRTRAPPWPWDEALSERILLRVMRGERLIDVARGPDFPGLHVLRRWRRTHPDFDAALGSAIGRGRREAGARRGLYTPKLADQVCARIAGGAALSDLRDDPRLPHENTLRAWSRTRPDFAARLADARDFRQWLIEDEISDIAATVTPATVKATKARIGRLRTRLRATAPKVRRRVKARPAV